MGCGCQQSVDQATEAGQQVMAQAEARKGAATVPSIAYTVVPDGGGDPKTFANGSSEQNQEAARMFAAANGGGWVRPSTGVEALQAVAA